MALELITFDVLSDNYGYIIHDTATGATAAIDVEEGKHGNCIDLAHGNPDT